MFGQKKKLIVRKKDLDQAILTKNMILMKECELLDADIKSKKTDIKDGKKAISEIVKSCRKEEDHISGLYTQTLSLTDSLDEMKGEITSLKKTATTLKGNTKSLASNEARLIADIDILDVELTKKITRKNEILDLIEANKGIKKQVRDSNVILSKLLKDIEVGKENASVLYSALAIQKEEHREAIKTMSIETKKIEANLKQATTKHKALEKECKLKSEQLEATTERTNAQVEGLNHLIKQRTDEYGQLGEQMIEKENDIKRAEFKASKIIEEANSSAGEIHKNFKSWKTDVLSEVTKLQLTSDINALTEAFHIIGSDQLSEVLNGA